MRKLMYSTLAAATLALAACGGDSSTAPTASVAGTYSLQTVNTQTLPYALIDDVDGKIEVLADTYNITDNGTYTNQTVVRTTIDGSATTDTLSSNGTYKQSGSSVTLTDASDVTSFVTATVTGSAMTISVEGFVLVYKRS